MTGKKNTPTVSVIVPTYNRAHLLGRALQSILKQTYRDFEVIVVDDGSTDNTAEIVRNFSAMDIRYIRHENNKGEAAARNTGVLAAKGEFIAFLDSDDEWLPEKLEKQMVVFQYHFLRVGVVYSNMCEIERNGKRRIWRSPTFMPEDGQFYRRALNYQVYGIGIGSSVVRKACFEKVGLFDERLSYYVDFDFFIRVSKEFCFYHIKEPLMHYYVTDDSFRWVTSAHIGSREVILEKYFDDIKRSRKTLSLHYWKMGRFLCIHNEVGRSRPYLIKAIKAYPLNFKALAFFVISVSPFGKRMFCAINSFKKRRTILKKCEECR
ncbi:UDP-Glc:alpha-D-GlcNAc-diphosphoundecaprenol beta-1,3-glucosyltransferase WfgD [bacterium BMS3Bbin07]|nr:UDP-Glc:alpha-D-GlcNAc-diphosphoundecaprenol beta-1,3-glucosyltransferase WfgD [bacterium BMS3Bbin07]